MQRSTSQRKPLVLLGALFLLLILLGGLPSAGASHLGVPKEVLVQEDEETPPTPYSSFVTGPRPNGSREAPSHLNLRRSSKMNYRKDSAITRSSMKTPSKLSSAADGAKISQSRNLRKKKKKRKKKNVKKVYKTTKSGRSSKKSGKKSGKTSGKKTPKFSPQALAFGGIDEGTSYRKGEIHFEWSPAFLVSVDGNEDLIVRRKLASVQYHLFLSEKPFECDLIREDPTYYASDSDTYHFETMETSFQAIALEEGTKYFAYAVATLARSKFETILESRSCDIVQILVASVNPSLKPDINVVGPLDSSESDLMVTLSDNVLEISGDGVAMLSYGEGYFLSGTDSSGKIFFVEILVIVEHSDSLFAAVITEATAFDVFDELQLSYAVTDFDDESEEEKLRRLAISLSDRNNRRLATDLSEELDLKKKQTAVSKADFGCETSYEDDFDAFGRVTPVFEMSMDIKILGSKKVDLKVGFAFEAGIGAKIKGSVTCAVEVEVWRKTIVRTPVVVIGGLPIPILIEFTPGVDLKAKFETTGEIEATYDVKYERIYNFGYDSELGPTPFYQKVVPTDPSVVEDSIPIVTATGTLHAEAKIVTDLQLWIYKFIGAQLTIPVGPELDIKLEATSEDPFATATNIPVRVTQFDLAVIGKLSLKAILRISLKEDAEECIEKCYTDAWWPFQDGPCLKLDGQVQDKKGCIECLEVCVENDEKNKKEFNLLDLDLLSWSLITLPTIAFRTSAAGCTGTSTLLNERRLPQPAIAVDFENDVSYKDANIKNDITEIIISSVWEEDISHGWEVWPASYRWGGSLWVPVRYPVVVPVGMLYWEVTVKYPPLPRGMLIEMESRDIFTSSMIDEINARSLHNGCYWEPELACAYASVYGVCKPRQVCGENPILPFSECVDAEHPGLICCAQQPTTLPPAPPITLPPAPSTCTSANDGSGICLSASLCNTRKGVPLADSDCIDLSGEDMQCCIFGVTYLPAKTCVSEKKYIGECMPKDECLTIDSKTPFEGFDTPGYQCSGGDLCCVTSPICESMVPDKQSTRVTGVCVSKSECEDQIVSASTEPWMCSESSNIGCCMKLSPCEPQPIDGIVSQCMDKDLCVGPNTIKHDSLCKGGAEIKCCTTLPVCEVAYNHIRAEFQTIDIASTPVDGGPTENGEEWLADMSIVVMGSEDMKTTTRYEFNPSEVIQSNHLLNQVLEIYVDSALMDTSNPFYKIRFGGIELDYHKPKDDVIPEASMLLAFEPTSEWETNALCADDDGRSYCVSVALSEMAVSVPCDCDVLSSDCCPVGTRSCGDGSCILDLNSQCCSQERACANGSCVSELGGECPEDTHPRCGNNICEQTVDYDEKVYCQEDCGMVPRACEEYGDGACLDSAGLWYDACAKDITFVECANAAVDNPYVVGFHTVDWTTGGVGRRAMFSTLSCALLFVFENGASECPEGWTPEIQNDSGSGAIDGLRYIDGWKCFRCLG